MKPTPATEFFAALTDLLLGADPHPRTPRTPRKCHWCRGDGEREDGSLCPVCDGWDGVIDGVRPEDD